MGLKLLARILLLIAGLHLLAPGVLLPVMSIALGPVTVQMLIGILCIALALYFIVKKVP